MVRATNTTPYLTLLRLRAMYPALFYPQDWYDSEEFASTPLEIGGHRFYVDLNGSPPSAVACAYYYIEHIYKKGNLSLWCKDYVWTSDYDSNGDRVYVGGWCVGTIRSGLQIHRHLTIRNVFELGYKFDGEEFADGK